MKPCLVIGSGFHSWVLGRPSTPLSSWDALIEEVSLELKVTIPSSTLSPVLRWEKMLELASSDGYQSPNGPNKWIESATTAVSQIEPHAKIALKKVIESHAQKYPFQSARAQLPFNDAFSSVISLNFDHCWIGPTNFSFGCRHSETKFTSLTKSEIGRLRNFIQCSRQAYKSVWFPNGSICDPTTIRMGLYDYGSQAHALRIAYRGIKAFEREIEEKLGAGDWAKLEPILENELSKSPEIQDPRLANWVAQFLYRPIFLAGVGLSHSETGLWWLLAQRARNLAKVPAKERPATVILVSSLGDQKALWANRPCGIEALYCENWDHGWEMILERATSKSIDGGKF